jgi:DNA mismatch endonuclease, patch repair protein
MEKRRADCPAPSSEEAKRRMQRTKQRDTAPELVLRKILFHMGLRYRVDRKPLPELRRRADIVFASIKVAVYVDGCFWHGCPQHATWPKQNAEFWRDKIETNRRRDADTDRQLTESGWLVVRVWEHEDAEEAAARVAAAVAARQSHQAKVGRTEPPIRSRRGTRDSGSGGTYLSAPSP